MVTKSGFHSEEAFIQSVLRIPENDQGLYDPLHGKVKLDDSILRCHEVLHELHLITCKNGEIVIEPPLPTDWVNLRPQFIPTNKSPLPYEPAPITAFQLKGDDCRETVRQTASKPPKAAKTNKKQPAKAPTTVDNQFLLELYKKCHYNIYRTYNRLPTKYQATITENRFRDKMTHLLYSKSIKKDPKDFGCIDDETLYDLYQQSQKIKTKLQNLLVLKHNISVSYHALCSRIKRIESRLLS